MLDVSVQTLETHLEPDSVLVTPPRIKKEDGNPESLKPDGESESTKNIQDMLSRVDNEYSCNICQKQFSSLCDVKLHLIESHKEKKHHSETQPSIYNNNNNHLRKKKKIKKMKKKFTAKKKPWCNYCWLKFKDIKQYQLHRKTFHPNLATQASTVPITETDSQSREGEQKEHKTVSLLDKGEEGEEIVDKPVLNVESNSSKLPLIRYERVDSSDRSLKRKLISLTSQDQENPDNIPIKSIKLVRNKNSEGYTTFSNPINADSTVGQSSSNQEDLCEKDPEVHYNFKANPSVDSLTISRNKPVRHVSASPLPLKDLKIILTERVEQVRHIDPSGVYICTELDKLGVTMENFHKEMDEVFPKPEEARVEEHDAQERL